MPLSTHTDTILRISDVEFSWGGDSAFSLAIDDFTIGQRERLLLMGPSGSGKSTFLSLICGIVSPQTGDINIAETVISDLRGAARDRFRAETFGIIFQMFNLLPYGSITDNVLLPLRFARARRMRAALQGTPAAEARRLLERLGLAPSLHRRAAPTLSVGQQQRVAVARALIGAPAVVIADEPTSALDQDHQEAFLNLLFEEVARAEATLIMVSHDPALASRFDRTVALADIAQQT